VDGVGRRHQAARRLRAGRAVIMSVLCLVLGVKLIGDAISGLTA
jgi:hypothetical protein